MMHSTPAGSLNYLAAQNYARGAAPDTSALLQSQYGLDAAAAPNPAAAAIPFNWLYVQNMLNPGCGINMASPLLGGLLSSPIMNAQRAAATTLNYSDIYNQGKVANSSPYQSQVKLFSYSKPKVMRRYLLIASCLRPAFL